VCGEIENCNRSGGGGDGGRLSIPMGTITDQDG